MSDLFAPVTDQELVVYAAEIRSHDPDISDDEMMRALNSIRREPPDQRAFFREIRRVAPAPVTYGWDKAKQEIVLWGVRLKGSA